MPFFMAGVCRMLRIIATATGNKAGFVDFKTFSILVDSVLVDQHAEFKRAGQALCIKHAVRNRLWRCEIGAWLFVVRLCVSRHMERSQVGLAGRVAPVGELFNLWFAKPCDRVYCTGLWLGADF